MNTLQKVKLNHAEFCGPGSAINFFRFAYFLLLAGVNVSRNYYQQLHYVIFGKKNILYVSIIVIFSKNLSINFTFYPCARHFD